jgi:hypothetical protein
MSAVEKAGRRKSGSRDKWEAYKTEPSLDTTKNGATVPQLEVVPQGCRIYDSKVMRMPWDVMEDHNLDEEQSQGLCVPLSRVEPCGVASNNVLPSSSHVIVRRQFALGPQDECVPLSPVGGMPTTPVRAARCTPPPNTPLGEKWLDAEDDSPNGGENHF